MTTPVYSVKYPGRFIIGPVTQQINEQAAFKSDQLLSSMLAAHQISTLSHCVRRKAGAVVICRDDKERRPRILGWGVNGMPTGEDNCCELPAPDHHQAPAGDPFPHLVTNPRVIHAEIRAIQQAMQTGVQPRDMIVLCTDSPCPECAIAIDRLGIAEVFFMFSYHAAVDPSHNFCLMHINPNLVLGMYQSSLDHLQQRIMNEV